MKLKLIFLAITLISVTNTFAQTAFVESAMKDVKLVPASGVEAIDDQKPCAVANKSSSRTITVKVEESKMVNHKLEKKIIVIGKLRPNEEKFIGYAGCDASIDNSVCTGYRIALAYYDENTPKIKTEGKSITAR